jgi:hypothetical protein
LLVFADDDADAGGVDKVVQQIEELSHGEAHKVVEAVLGAYFKKWWNDAPAAVHDVCWGRIAVAIEASDTPADGFGFGLEHLVFKWDAQYQVLEPVTVDSQLPLSDE